LLPQIAFISLKNDRFLRVNRGEKGILRTWGQYWKPLSALGILHCLKLHAIPVWCPLLHGGGGIYGLLLFLVQPQLRSDQAKVWTQATLGSSLVIISTIIMFRKIN
jgi:hypothetical protein